jgi:diguanylate cyclase (GGDEF)-like protein
MCFTRSSSIFEGGRAMSDEALLKSLRDTGEFLHPFNEIAKALTSTLEPREVLSLIVKQISTILHPASWCLLLEDPSTGELYFEIAVGEGAEELKGMRLDKDEAIARVAFNTGEPQLVEDMSQAAGFSKRFNQLNGVEAQNLVALPLKARGRVLGVLEIINCLSKTTRPEHLQALRAIADYAAIAIENARNFQRVQELTITDEHTGLYNARHLYDALTREVDRAHRFNRPLSLVFVDLDHFKHVNDAHGHLAGSAVLREIGELFQGTIRKVDAAFRYGGDEFALLLVETDTTGALAVSQRLRTRLKHHTFLEKQGFSLKLTASMGIATYPNHAANGTDLLHAADRAMYRAKELGRDEVVSTSDLAPLWSPTSPPTPRGPGDDHGK